jgi:hypothetical protein
MITERRSVGYHAVSCSTRETDPVTAGTSVARKIVDGFGSHPLRVVIVYATVNYDQEALLGGVRAALGPGVVVVGCSAQGVMSNGMVDEGGFAVGAMGLGGSSLKVAAAHARDVHLDTEAKGKALADTLRRQLGRDPRLTILTYDPLCGIDVDQLLAGVRHQNSSTIVGAAAGQPAGPTARTYQYRGLEAFNRGGVALGVDGDFSLDVGVSHGTTPTGVAMTLTRAEGNRLLELDGRRALDVYLESVGCSENEIYNQDYSSGLALGIERRIMTDGREEAAYLIRAAFGFERDTGAIAVQAAIPQGSRIMLHHRTVEVVKEGALAMGKQLAARLQGRHPWAVLGFECGARTTPFLGQADTLDENLLLQKTVAPDAPWLGVIGWGEIAPCGGVPEFHNYTYPLVVLS